MKTRIPLLALLLTAALLMVAACQPADMAEDMQAPAPQAEVTLTFSTRAGAVIPAYDPSPEYTVATLRVYVVDAAGAAHHYYIENSDEAQREFTVEVGKLPAGTTRFYVIANEGAAGELRLNNGATVSLGPDTDPATLADITFSHLPQATLTSGDASAKDETGKAYRGAVLPMTGTLTRSLSGKQDVGIELTRCVAKLYLHFAMIGDEGDEVYMGRGLYLYNQPQYAHLFPRTTYAGPFDHLEDENVVGPDSKLFQMNGRVILSAAWPDGPAYSDQDPANLPMLQTQHINRITNKYQDKTDLTHDDRCQMLPARPIYLLPNPNTIPGGSVHANPRESDVRGYYLKLLPHEHEKEGSNDMHEGDQFYVSLPAVQANDIVDVHSAINVNWHHFQVKWIIDPWTAAGGDVEFN